MPLSLKGICLSVTVVLCATESMVWAAQVVGTPQGGSYALIVAIESYRDLPAATGAAADGEHYKSLAQTTFGIRPERIRIATDGHATKADIERQLDWLRNNVANGDRLYFFYSGHGAPDPASGTPYLVPYDADSSALQRSALPFGEVLTALNRTKAKEVVAFVDACFSGEGGRSLLPPGARPIVTVRTHTTPERVALFTAVSGSEVAGPAGGRQGGIFSTLLFQGLTNGTADLDGDEQVTAAELQAWLAPRVTREALKAGRTQSPSLRLGKSIHSPNDLSLLWGMHPVAGPAETEGIRPAAPQPPPGPSFRQPAVQPVPQPSTYAQPASSAPYGPAAWGPPPQATYPQPNAATSDDVLPLSSAPQATYPQPKTATSDDVLPLSPAPQAAASDASPPDPAPAYGPPASPRDPVPVPPGLVASPPPSDVASPADSTVKLSDSHQSSTKVWRVAGLLTAGVGLVGVGTGAYFGYRAQAISNELASSPTFNSKRDQDRKTAITVQYISYAAGGVAVASGLTMYLLGRNISRIALAPQFSSGYAGATLQGPL